MKSIILTRKKGVAIIAAAIIVLILVSITIVKANAGSKTEVRTIPPSTAGVAIGDMDQRVTASGTTQAANDYSIFIELSQEVEEVFVEVGDYVEEGQLLVTYAIDDTKKELERKVTEAQISLQNAQISLDEIVAPAEGTELIDLKTAVINAEEALQNAKTDYTDFEKDLSDAEKNLPYYKQLLETGSLSQSEYDSYETEYNNLVNNKQTKADTITTAQLALEKAQLNLENGTNKLNDTSTQNSYQKQLNSIKTAQMNLETAQENLAKLTEATYSPISGTVIECNAVEGQMLTDSTVMMKVADLTDLDVTAYVSEYDIAKVAVGQKVELTTDGIEDKIYMGTVTKIEPTAESQGTISGSETVVPIVVHMDAPDELVKPGFSFDMEIIVVDLTDTEYIPLSAVMKDKDTEEYYVYVVNSEQILEKRNVEIGTTSDLYAQLISGLDESDIIMESPDDTVSEGSSLMDYATTVISSEGSSSESSSLLGGLTGGGVGGSSGMPSGGGMPGGGGMPSGSRRP